MFTIPEQTLFGLDIGITKLRLAQIRTLRRRKVITALREADIPAGVIVDGQIADPQHLSRLIAALYHKRERGDRIGGNGVISALPESKTFMKLITVETRDPERIKTLLPEEIPRHIPLPLGEVYYDWQITKAVSTGPSHCLIGVAPRPLVDAYLAVLRGAGLLPFALEIEASPITRCLLKEASVADTGAQIIIDLGATRTGLIVIRDGIIQFTVSLPISGVRITHTIAETLKINTQEAEEAKLVCGLDPDRCHGALKRVLHTTFDDLCRKIETAIEFYQENFPDHLPIREVVLTGGGANFLQVDRSMAEHLSVPVRPGNPLSNVELGKMNVAASALQSYVTAIGLALRGTQGEAVI